MLLYKQDIRRLITKTAQNFNPGLVLSAFQEPGPGYWVLAMAG